MSASPSGRGTGSPRPVALITGGSSGIGLAMARKLAASGHDLALLARGAERLDAAQAAIGSSFPEARVSCHSVDVGDAAAVSGAVADIVAGLGVPRLAVMNAGIALPGHFLDQPLDQHSMQMRTNYMGALNIAHALAPRMSDAGGGHMVFVSSGAAFFGIYGYSAYAPSKFAMRGLAEVLRVELAPHGIGVTLAYPPDTDTPQLVAENETKPLATKQITAGGGLWSADAVAERILRAVEKGRFVVAPGLQMTVLAHAHSLLGPALRIWQTRIARNQRGG